MLSLNSDPTDIHSTLPPVQDAIFELPRLKKYPEDAWPVRLPGQFLYALAVECEALRSRLVEDLPTIEHLAAGRQWTLDGENFWAALPAMATTNTSLGWLGNFIHTLESLRDRIIGATFTGPISFGEELALAFVFGGLQAALADGLTPAQHPDQPTISNDDLWGLFQPSMSVFFKNGNPMRVYQLPQPMSHAEARELDCVLLHPDNWFLTR